MLWEVLLCYTRVAAYLIYAFCSQAEVRKMYQTLLEKMESFEGFDVAIG